jgi:hypothetical protein
LRASVRRGRPFGDDSWQRKASAGPASSMAVAGCVLVISSFVLFFRIYFGFRVSDFEFPPTAQRFGSTRPCGEAAGKPTGSLIIQSFPRRSSPKKTGENISNFCLTAFKHIPNILTACSGSGVARASEWAKSRHRWQRSYHQLRTVIRKTMDRRPAPSRRSDRRRQALRAVVPMAAEIGSGARQYGG